MLHSGVTQEVRDYYKNRFGYEDVDFQTPYSLMDNWSDPGKIILTRNGETKEIEVTDALFERGFDGIEDVMAHYRDHWEDGDTRPFSSTPSETSS